MNMKRLSFVILVFVLLLNIKVDAKTDEEVIKTVSDANIMTGTGAGFEEEKTLTRAEVTTIVVRMKGMEEDAVPEVNYDDVDKENWAYKYVSIATKEGITNGVGNNCFLPDREVTVGETVTMLIRAISGDVETIEKSGSWPNNYINYAKKYNLLDGITKGKNDVIQRIDTARLISNILESPYYNTDDTKEEKEKVEVSKAACGVIVSVAQMADEYNEVELAVPGKIVTLMAHDSELPAGVVLPGTYVDFWLAGTRMWDIHAEEANKVTDVTKNYHMAKIIKFDSEGVVRLVRRPADDVIDTKKITVSDTEYVDANTIVFLACDEMTDEALGDDKYLKEFDNLRIGSEFDIELTNDYRDNFTYNEMDGTEVFYQSITNKNGDEVIVSVIYVKD